MNPFYAKQTSIHPQLPFFPMLCTLLTTVLILKYPILTRQYTENALLLWFQQILPCQFTALLLLQLWEKYGLIELINGVLGKGISILFGISQAAAFILLSGILFGFPAGGVSLKMALEKEEISEKEGRILLPCCNLLGPPFLFAYFYPTYSSIMPGNPSIFRFACIYYGIPLGTLLFYGNGKRILLLFHKKNNPAVPSVGIYTPPKKTFQKRTPASFSSMIQETLIRTATLAGYMMFFSTCKIYTIFLPETLRPFFSALLEVSDGCNILMPSYPLIGLSVLSFGGISCIAQTYSIFPEKKSILTYTAYKLLFAGLTFLTITLGLYVCYFVW